jgi:hypothetical protein
MNSLFITWMRLVAILSSDPYSNLLSIWVNFGWLLFTLSLLSLDCTALSVILPTTYILGLRIRARYAALATSLGFTPAISACTQIAQRW